VAHKLLPLLVFRFTLLASSATAQGWSPIYGLWYVSQEAPSTIISQRHASTAIEGYLRGTADYVRAVSGSWVERAQARLIHAYAWEKELYTEDLRLQLKRQQIRAAKQYQRQSTFDAYAINTRIKEAKESRTIAGALQLLSGAKAGITQWPDLLERQYFAKTIADIEVVLERWPADPLKASPSERQQLDALARRLLSQIDLTRNSARYVDRQAAIRSVKQLQKLAAISHLDVAQSTVASTSP
jgi:hypothetical protein